MKIRGHCKVISYNPMCKEPFEIVLNGNAVDFDLAGPKLVIETSDIPKRKNIEDIPQEDFLTGEMMIDISHGDAPDDVKVIQVADIFDQDRWYTYYSCVVEYRSNFWSVSWKRGSTEYQDEGSEDIMSFLVNPSYSVVLKFD